MRLFNFFQLLFLINNYFSLNNDISPFSSIKMEDDNIFVTIDLKSSKWSKLLSINNFGSDAIVNYSKEHFGLSKCDFEIECYKFNIIKNFNDVYKLMSNKNLGMTVSLELE